MKEQRKKQIQRNKDKHQKKAIVMLDILINETKEKKTSDMLKAIRNEVAKL